MNTALLRALVALLPACLLFLGSIIQFPRYRSLWPFVQVLGTGCMVLAVFVHICEALHWFPSMGWGLQNSAGHCIDLGAVILGLTLFPVGYFLHALFPRYA